MSKDIVVGSFVWDSAKAESNLKKHGVAFEEAMTAFEDESAVMFESGPDGDIRVALIGFSIKARLLVVVHVDTSNDRIRIISARKGDKHDARKYSEG